VQYALLIYGDEDAWGALADDERGALYKAYGALSSDLRGQGKLLAGEELQSIATATSVRVRDDESLVSDGPFAETKEALGGFYLIEAETLDEAIEWASRIPSARTGTIEIRPVVDHPGTGT
jgi:hypothetical protein